MRGSCLQEVPNTCILYSDLTWKLLGFWKTGCLGEVVTSGGSTVLNLIRGLLFLFGKSQGILFIMFDIILHLSSGTSQ